MSRGGGGRTPFEEFFGDEFFRRFFGDVPERIPQRSLGSGVIIDPSGIALTNAHVIEGAQSITVRFFDGETAEAELVGSFPDDDVALVRVDETERQAALTERAIGLQWRRRW